MTSNLVSPFAAPTQLARALALSGHAEEGLKNALRARDIYTSLPNVDPVDLAYTCDVLHE